MPRIFVAVLLAAVLAGCAAQQGNNQEASAKLCWAVEEGARAQLNLDACTAVILGSDSQQDRINAYNYRGAIYSTTGRDDLALADFDKALQLAPDFSAAHNNRANLLSRRGQDEAAERDFQAAIHSDPNNATAYNNYAWHLASRGNYAAAVVQAERAVALVPDKASNHDTLAHALMGVGRTADAEAAFAKAMDIDGTELIARYQRVLIAKGYAPGRSDGMLDAETWAALRACIRDNCRLLMD